MRGAGRKGMCGVYADVRAPLQASSNYYGLGTGAKPHHPNVMAHQ